MKKIVEKSLDSKYDISMFKPKYFYSFLKRCFDVFSSSLGIIIFSWLFIILILMVKCTSKGPVFYGHKRIGKNGKAIKIWKFRSMKVDNRPLNEILTPEQYEEYKRDYKITNDPRITKIGKFLRKTSLDELPQLWNIFIGNMSVIGWRPIIQEELDRYGENGTLLTKIKPGLTGFWASHGRSKVKYEQRMKMELFYTIHRSILFDLRILFFTVIGVFRGDGAK